MPYPIEIISNDESLYSPVIKALDSLNQIQKEFSFTLVSPGLRNQATVLNNTEYNSEDLFQFLRNFRNNNGGHHPYLILVFKQPLSGLYLGNLFGNHSANEGLAIFTTHSFDQFVFDLVRYCRYYLIRYALSFLAPGIKSHETRDCMFDKKIRKRDIQLSMSSGRICDDCKAQLLPHLNPDISKALNDMLALLSYQIPYSFILKGGGVKGLAYIGAILELEKYFSLNCFAGTSAGAITAVLLGAGYSPSELKEVFKQLEFMNLLDVSVGNLLCNLVFRGGVVPGKKLERTIDELVGRKVPSPIGKVALVDLPNRCIAYATRRGDGLLTFDSAGARKETIASFAVRCSISIPFVFTAPKIEGMKVYDGGMKANFPVEQFARNNPELPFFGLYLYSKSSKDKKVLGDLTDIITETEKEILKLHEDRIIYIETTEVNTLEFDLSEEKKDYLLLSGRLAVLEFLSKYFPDFNIPQVALQNLRKELKTKIAGIQVRN